MTYAGTVPGPTSPSLQQFGLLEATIDKQCLAGFLIPLGSWLEVPARCRHWERGSGSPKQWLTPPRCPAWVSAQGEPV
jgi:hypothetical protein